MERGAFADEIVAVTRSGRAGQRNARCGDEHPRPETTLEALGKAQAGVQSRRHRDGRQLVGHQRRRGRAAALRGASRRGAWACAPMARFVALRVAGVAPDVMGLGPIPATRKALARAGMGVARTRSGRDQRSVRGAGARLHARPASSIRAKTNVNGGAIALGHPLGASGARIATTLLHELRRRGGRYGLATMCIGVGQGIATIFERVE